MKSEIFDWHSDLTKFVNENRINKNNIVSITCTVRGTLQTYTLFYF